MKQYLLPLGAILALLAGFYFLSDHSDGGPELPYEERIEQHRREIDYFMRNDEGSPFASQIEIFKGLQYYPATPEFIVQATFSYATTMSSISISTTDGKESRYLPYGYLDFEIGGVKQRLTVYQSSESRKTDLFLGFGDATSAEETYGGGRYLNFNHNGETQVVLDFNLAYNPYCAYNPEFVCPIPPRENLLSVAIKAGEKDFDP